MQKSISERVSLEAQLRKAILEQQFELYYQPQIDQNNKIHGAEALIRWHHPTQGIVTPQNFISLAEDTGLIVPIGEWVLRTACAQLKRWQEVPETSHLSLSVNVSYKQFEQSSFSQRIKCILDEYAIDPTMLKIELTESMLAEDLELTVGVMKTLGDMGIQLSLDDFGTGYSSLQYLKNLPLYQLKIDRSFVCDLMTDKSDRSIVRTIISIANELRLNVIAEGVETEEQRLYLLKKGCRFFQGYLFSKPIPVSEFVKLLAQ